MVALNHVSRRPGVLRVSKSPTKFSAFSLKGGAKAKSEKKKLKAFCVFALEAAKIII